MKKHSRLEMVLLVALLALAACNGLQGDEITGSPVGSQSVIQGTPPDDFAGLTNPLRNDEKTLSEGDALFQANCSSCHGPGGEGDGPASEGLNPPPRNLAESQSELSDAYLYWRISEGGLMEPFSSLMPAWRGLLNDEQIWQIITYVRTMGN